MTNVKPSPPWAGGRFSRKPRRFAIGDVHGCSRTLQTLVEEVIRPEPDDVIFLLGDYIDRGPDSKGVLNYLMALFEREDFLVFSLMGNHEELCLKAAAGDKVAEKIWYGNGGYGTLQSFGVGRAEDIPTKYLNFMAAMGRIKVENNYILVHAGLDFATEDPIRDSSSEFMLWDRSERVQPVNIGDRTLVCGHTVTPLFQIKESLTTRVIRLDNGCYDKGHMGYGSLVALDMNSRELVLQENCE